MPVSICVPFCSEEFPRALAGLMEDDIDLLEQKDRDAAVVYQNMMLFLKEEHREVKIMDHKFTLRATTNGRVRGLYSEIFKLLKHHSDLPDSPPFNPGMLAERIEEAKVKIDKLLTEPSQHTTMLTITKDGFADSDPNGPDDFTAEELEPLEVRCRNFWMQDLPHYNHWRSKVNRAFPHLSEQHITQAFLRYTSIDKISEQLQRISRSHQPFAHTIDESDGDDDDDDDDEYMPAQIVVKDEDIATLKSMLPSYSDAELKQALISNNGNVELAADHLLSRNS